MCVLPCKLCVCVYQQAVIRGQREGARERERERERQRDKVKERETERVRETGRVREKVLVLVQG